MENKNKEELKGEVVELNLDFAYIMGENNKLYLFFKSDILEDEVWNLGQKVLFKPELKGVFRATYVSVL